LLHERTLSLVLALAVVMAAVVACSSEETAGSVHGQGVYIPEQWQTARTVDGHHQHVVLEKIACNKCHELTETEIGPVVPERCAHCHEKEGKLEHAVEQAREAFGPTATADCRNCHAFTVALPKDAAHQGPIEPFAPSDCARCHLLDQGDVPAVRVHHTQECLSCHRPHEQEKPVSAPCSDCHEVSTTHAATGKDIVATCSTCHTHQHAPAAEARGTCAPCHQTQHPRVPETALFEGHTECVGCHRPHDFGKTQAIACRNCHEDMLVLGGSRVQPHNECTNCHDPHDVKNASATACARCHTSVTPNHPKHGKAGTCTGCHDPHPSSAHAGDRARNCSSCHHQAAHDKSLHQGVNCRDCHQPHDFLLAAKGVTLCAQCHAENTRDATSLEGHAACANCHRGLPHRPEALQVQCQSCHHRQHGEVNKGHTECQGCHEPHAGTLQKECKSCHADVHRAAPKGHQTCLGCHQPHSGSPTANPCSACHAPIASSPHGKLSAQCNDCHRPHGPSGTARPPPCGSCHQPQTLQGLHTVAQHADCRRCHTEHGQKQAERPRCLGCHTDRNDHFPNAPACVSCHLFTPTR
jgi:predicted CXXCH cytochrome family protein